MLFSFYASFNKAVSLSLRIYLLNNGAQFTHKLLTKQLRPDRTHPFTALCNELGIEHRTTQFRHPWINGQVEITNKTIKEATTKKYHYADFDELKRHLITFLLYYNYQRALKSLKLKTPWELVQKWYDEKPDLFKSDPSRKIAGLNTYQYHNTCINIYLVSVILHRLRRKPPRLGQNINSCLPMINLRTGKMK